MGQENIKKASKLIVALFFSGVAFIPHWACAAADDTKSAADTIATANEYWDQLRRLCTEVILDERRGLAAAYFHWVDQNRTELLAVRAWRITQANGSDFDNATRAKASAQLVPIQQFNADQRRSVCVGAFRMLVEGRQDFIRKAPAQSALLTEFLKQHPLTEEQMREYDNPLGCAKKIVETGGRSRPRKATLPMQLASRK